MKTMIKAIGKRGQVALGKEFAGKKALIQKVDAGVWLIKLGEFIPDNERWLTQPQVEADLDEAIEWAENHPPESSDMEALEARVHS